MGQRPREMYRGGETSSDHPAPGKLWLSSRKLRAGYVSSGDTVGSDNPPTWCAMIKNPPASLDSAEAPKSELPFS